MVNWPKLVLRSLGRRLPITTGTLHVDGIDAEVAVRRDRFGVPHISASGDADAWFALGFCHGQDRPFQVETRLRVVRGTLAALIGADGVAVDRLSRRIGFRRYGEAVVAALEPDRRRLAAAYAAGVSAGTRRGLPRPPHALALLRSEPSIYDAADAFGLLALLCFALASNWDAELARLQILAHDGPDAVAALDPAYPHHHPASDRPGQSAGRTADALSADLAALAATVGWGGGSNNWAISPERTATGRPILANDPHLAPMLPAHWYLAHLSTPEWSLVGASVPGAPVFGAGHNGRAAWGVTAGMIDNTDLFLEEIGPDGASVRRGDRFVACIRRREIIAVRGGEAEAIDSLETDRGPIVGPALDGAPAVSMAATWLDPRPLGAVFDIGRVETFEHLRRLFEDWNSLPLNVVSAAEDGTIGWQLIGSAPRRRRGGGLVPLPAWEPDTGWHPEPVPFSALPHVRDPAAGFVATANNLPSADGPYLGADFLDGYRVARICEMLADRTDWDVGSVLRMQQDRRSLPWREMRDAVLAAVAGRPELERAARMLDGWDGEVSPDSSAATLFELLVAGLSRRVAAAAAPNGARWALGTGFHPLVPSTMFVVRRVSHLVRLVCEQPEGWFPGGWDAEIAAALAEADALVAERFGPDPGKWRWGVVRPQCLRHPLGRMAPLQRVFDLGPVPLGGDANTINPSPVDPRDPLDTTDFAVASMRMVVDVGDWERSRFVLAGGQSGNPFSPHYGDLFALWARGDAIPIPRREGDVARATRATLLLRPPEGRSG